MYKDPEDKFKRVNILIRPDQYQRIQEENMALSGTVRGLLDDFLSSNRITLAVSQKTQKLYRKIIANYGGDDREIEARFIRTLDDYLASKIDEIEKLRKTMKQQSKK